MAKKKRAILYAQSATSEGNTINHEFAESRAMAQPHGCTVIGESSEVAISVARRVPEQARVIAQAEGAV